MSGIADKQVLIIGAGNMGRPIVDSVLSAPGMNPAHVTVVLGAAHEAELRAHIAECFGESVAAATRLRTYQAIAQDSDALKTVAPDYVFYCAKPQKFPEIAPLYAACLAKPNQAQIISIAAGLQAHVFARAWGDHHPVFRTVPHLPLTLYGIYSAGHSVSDELTQMLRGMGKPISLLDEGKAFITYTAHAGCGPAFVAQFIRSQAGDGRTQQQKIIDHLRKLCTGASSNARYVPDSCEGAAERFYQNWLKKAKADLGDSGTSVVNAVIQGTLDDLEKHPGQSLVDYANKVRSPKGVTNAGLICMGLPVPDEERYGDAGARATQNRMAQEYQHLDPAQSIVHALVASEMRAAAMAGAPSNDPLHGMDFAQVNAVAQQIITASGAVGF